MKAKRPPRAKAKPRKFTANWERHFERIKNLPKAKKHLTMDQILGLLRD